MSLKQTIGAWSLLIKPGPEICCIDISKKGLIMREKGLSGNVRDSRKTRFAAKRSTWKDAWAE